MKDNISKPHGHGLNVIIKIKFNRLKSNAILMVAFIGIFGDGDTTCKNLLKRNWY